MEACKGVLVPDGTRHCFVEERGLGRRNEFRLGGNKGKGRGKGVYEPLRPSIDHWIPKSQGGTDDSDNLHVVHDYDQCVQGAMFGNASSYWTSNKKKEHARMMRDARNPEKITENAIKGYFKRNATAEQLSAWGKVGGKSLTPEQRSAAGRASQAARTPEEKSELGRRARAKSTCNHVRWHVNAGKPCNCKEEE